MRNLVTMSTCVAVLFAASQTATAGNVFIASTASGNWSNVNNWMEVDPDGPNNVPGSPDAGHFNTDQDWAQIGKLEGPHDITVDGTFLAYRMQMWPDNTLNVPGGSQLTFDVSGQTFIMGARAGAALMTTNVTGGIINAIAGDGLVADFTIANLSGTNADLNVTAGEVNVAGRLQVGLTGTGHVQIDGGFVWAETLDWEGNGGDGSLDITGTGQLRLDGDVRDQVNALIASGGITADNGTAQPNVDFGTLNAGKTTVFGFGPILPIATDFEWNRSGLGDWANGDNWTLLNGQPPDPRANSPSHSVLFPDTITTTTNVSTHAAVTVNHIEFVNSTASYVISGLGSVNMAATTSTTPPPEDPSMNVLGTHEFQTSVNFQNDATIDVALNSVLTFNNAVDLNGNVLTKTGAGELSIRNDLLTTGGTLNCAEGTCSGSGTISGDVINGGGTISPGNSSGVMAIEGSLSVVPEPTTAILLGLGLMGWFTTCWRGRTVGRADK